MLLVAAASLYRRRVLTYRSLSWRLLTLCDHRVSHHQKRAVGDEWDVKRACCLNPGFGRQLKTKGVTSADLTQSPLWQSFLLQYSRAISQQVCDLEWRHGRNRGRSHGSGQSRFHVFCANATNAEARLLHAARGAYRDAWASKDSMRPAPPVHDARPTSLPKLLLRAQTPKEIHKKEWEAAERCRGRLLNSASQEAWADWRAAYDSLPPAKVALLSQRAEQSKHIARANRERVKAQRCAQDAAAGGTDATTTTESSPSSVAPVAVVGWPSSTVALRHFADRDDLNVNSFIEQTSLREDGTFPLAEPMVANHGSFQNACKSFQARCTFARAASDDAFPDHVTFPGQCKLLCSASIGDEIMAFFD